MYSSSTRRINTNRYATNGLHGGCCGSSTNGLADANYNATTRSLRKPSTAEEQRLAVEAARRLLGGNTSGIQGTYTGAVQELPVYGINNYDLVATIGFDNLSSDVTYVVEPGKQISVQDWKSLISVSRLPAEFVAVSIVQRKDQIKKVDDDCPPPTDCQEKWVDKTLHVSAKPSPDAIEIPVAFKKLICEGESTNDPEVDCDELLKALQESMGGSGVSGIMGLSAVPNDYPPDWCKDCEEKLVKASAYVTESPVQGSKPFKVKVKVLVCETSTEPKIDCAEIIKALGDGMRNKKRRTMNGLSEATMRRGTTQTASAAGKEFDDEANRLDPNRKPQQAGTGSLWWLWVLLAAGVAYSARKL